MHKTFLFTFALIAGCDLSQGIQPLEHHCTKDSSVCWTQAPGDPRNTPANDPRTALPPSDPRSSSYPLHLEELSRSRRTCENVKLDSLWLSTCTYVDTVWIVAIYSQSYKDLHPEYTKRGGNEIVIVSGDTISNRKW